MAPTHAVTTRERHGHDQMPRPSVEQAALLLVDHLRGAGSGTVVVSVEFEGHVDPPLLARAWRSLVARHVALRTEFELRGAQVSARIRTEVAADAPSLRVIELDDDAERNRALTALTAARLDPTGWPLCRASVLHGRRSDLLLLAFHSIVFDDLSAEIAVRDLLALYDAHLERVPAKLTALPADLGDFVAAEQRAMVDLEARARAYWEPTLAAVADASRIPILSTPVAGEDPTEREAVAFSLDGTCKQQLKQVAASNGASLFTCVVAAVQVLQYRYAGGSDDGVATALTVDARPRRFRGAIGMFSNELPLFSMPGDDLRFGGFLSQVRARTTELFELRRFPITEALARYGDSAGEVHASGQVALTYRRSGRLARPPGIERLAANILPKIGNPRVLAVSFSDTPVSLDVRLDYDPRVLTRAPAQRMAEHLRQILASIGDDPNQPIGELRMLSAGERRRIVSEWGGMDAPAIDRATVQALVEDQVRRAPDSTAVSFDGLKYTYAELNARANRLAHHLRGQGVGPDALVALCVERSAEQVVGLLGILKAGGAYVPLDPSYPTERLQVMIDDARPRVLLSQESLEARLPRTRGKFVLLDRDAEEFASQPDTNPEPLATPDALAYVIFTSGSTGRPKGVAMPHRALVNLLEWQRRRFVHGGPRRTLQFTSVSFDVGFQEIFSTLVTGGALVVISDEQRRDFDQLATLVDDERIERLFIPPLALGEIARRLSLAGSGTSEVEITTAGERLEITAPVRELFGARPTWTLDNHYGPTESHVVTAHRLEGDAEAWPELPPIGRPIAGARIYLLDRRLSPVPIGVPGELFIGGIPVARGYINQPKRTAERFVDDPFAGLGTRMYRTGDLARWREDGSVEFLGRTDDQVKIRGFRVEPGDVASALSAHPDVQRAAVVAGEDSRGSTRLVAYVVAREGCAPSSRGLREFVVRSLPDYMIPAAFVTVEALPLTPNGKLDRRALPAPQVSAESDEDYVTPANPIEARLAEIWARALGLERIGRDDNFFGLGGHSLLAGDVIAQTCRDFDVHLPLRAIFGGPTVAQMAEAVVAARDSGATPTRIPRAPRKRLGDPG